MKILLILPEYPPSFGGMQTHAVYLSGMLHTRNHDIQVVTYRSLKRLVREQSIQYDMLQPFITHRILSRTGFWSNIQKLCVLINDFKPDLVYSSTTFYGLLQSLTGYPVVCRSVGNDILRCWIGYPYRAFSGLASTMPVERAINRLNELMKNPGIIKSLFMRQRQKLIEKSSRAASCILANSHFTAGLLRNLGVKASRIEVVVGGVEYNRFAVPPGRVSRARYRLPRKAFVLLTACRLVEKKGIDFLLETLARINPREINYRLLIAGEGKLRKKLEKLALNLGLADRVRFLGAVPHEELEKLYALADVFVLPSREHELPTGQKDVETMGRVLCEANAAGIPVIASDSGGIPSVIKHKKNGILFHELDHDDLLSAVRACFFQTVDVEKMVRNGKEAAKNKFDWSVVIRKHEKTFQKVLSVPGKPRMDEQQLELILNT